MLGLAAPPVIQFKEWTYELDASASVASGRFYCLKVPVLLGGTAEAICEGRFCAFPT